MTAWNLCKYSCLARGNSDWKQWRNKWWALKMGRWHEKIRFIESCLVVAMLCLVSRGGGHIEKNEDSLSLATWTWISHVSDPFSQLIFCFPIVSNQSPSDKNVNICLNSSVHDNQLITSIMIVRNFLSNYPISKGFRHSCVLLLLLDFKKQSFSKNVIQKTHTKTCQ